MGIEVERLEAEISVDATSAAAELKAFDTAVRAVSQDRTAKVDVDLDKKSAAAAEKELDKTARDREATVEVKKGKSFGKIMGFASKGGMFAGIYGLITAVPTALTGIAGLAGGLMGTLGPLLGLIGAFPAALGSMGAAVGTTMIAVGGVTNAFKLQAKAVGGSAEAQKAYADALKKLSPPAQRFVKMIQHDYIPAFKNLRKHAEAAFFKGGITEGMKSFSENLKRIKRQIVGLSGDLGRTAGHFAKFWGKSDNADRLMNAMSSTAKTTNSFLKLLTPISRLMVAIVTPANRLVRKLLEGTKHAKGLIDVVKGWSRNFEHAKNSGLDTFFNKTYKFTILWSRVLSPIAKLIGKVVTAAEPLATWMLEGITKHFNALNDATNTNKLAKYFNDQKPAIREFSGLINDVFGALFNRKTNGENSSFVKTLKALRKDFIPPFRELLDTLDKSNVGSTFATLLGNVTSGITALVKHDSALDLIVRGINGLADALKSLSHATGGKSTQAIMAALTAYGLFKVGRRVALGKKGAAGGPGGLVGAYQGIRGVVSPKSKGKHAATGTGLGSKVFNTTAALGSLDSGKVKGATGSMQRLGGSISKAAGSLSLLGFLASFIPGPMGDMASKVSSAAFAVEILMNVSIMSSAGLSKLTGATKAATVANAAAAGGAKKLTAAQKILNVVMMANPIGIVIGVLMLLAGAFYLLYKKSETFRNFVNQAFGALKDSVSSMWSAIKPIFEAMKPLLEQVGKAILNLWIKAGKYAMFALINAIAFLADQFAYLLQGLAMIPKTSKKFKAGALEMAEGLHKAAEESRKLADNMLKEPKKTGAQKAAEKLKVFLKSLPKATTTKVKVENAEKAKDQIEKLARKFKLSDKQKNALLKIAIDKGALAKANTLADAVKKVGRAKGIAVIKIRGDKAAKSNVQSVVAKVERFGQLNVKAQLGLNGFKKTREDIDTVHRALIKLDKVTSRPAITINISGAMSAIQRINNSLDRLDNRTVSPQTQVTKRAKGGYMGLVRGPGSTTSDSILTALSNKEFVVNAKATQNWLPTLEAINSGYADRFVRSQQFGGSSAANGPVTNVTKHNEITQVFNEKVDPNHLASALAWSLR